MEANLNFSAPVFFDLETGGTNHKKHPITSIAMYCPTTKDKLEIKVKFDPDECEEEALEVQGYKKKKWKKAIKKEKAMKKVKKFLNAHKSATKISKKGKEYSVAVLAGFNASSFDKLFLIKLFKDFDEWCPFDYQVFDVYELAKWMFPGKPSYSLEGLCNELCLPERKWHDPMSDVLATIDLCCWAASKSNVTKEWIKERIEEIEEYRAQVIDDDCPWVQEED